MNKVEGDTLPCGYIMGVHGALASGIPGLKSETWGTLRVFPLALVGKGQGVDRRDVHRFFRRRPIGKQKLFSEHPACQRLSRAQATQNRQTAFPGALAAPVYQVNSVQPSDRCTVCS